jgi:hypothetical protein
MKKFKLSSNVQFLGNTRQKTRSPWRDRYCTGTRTVQPAQSMHSDIGLQHLVLYEYCCTVGVQHSTSTPELQGA